MIQQREPKITWNDLDEPNKLIITSIDEGNGEYEHLERLIRKSRAIAQQRVDYLIELGLLERLMGPSGKKALKNGLRLTKLGKELFNAK